MRQFTAGQNEEGVRLSRFVLRTTQKLPNNLLYKSFRNRRIKVNGKRAMPDTLLHQSDVIELYLNDEFFPETAHPTATVTPTEDIPYPPVYEGAQLAILYKPAGVLSHRGEDGTPGLLEAYTSGLIARGLFDPAAENGFSPALAGRLDRNTEGLIPVALIHPALRELNRLQREGELQKTYLCVTNTRPPEGQQHAFLARDRQKKQVNVYGSAHPGAKPIETHITVLEEKNGLCLCEIGLLTGRTHQIRAHLAFLGAPLLGDAKYGRGGKNSPYPGPGQALCAWKLAFPAQLPQGNPLAPLAGKQFTAESSALLAWWRRQP